MSQYVLASANQCTKLAPATSQMLLQVTASTAKKQPKNKNYGNLLDGKNLNFQ